MKVNDIRKWIENLPIKERLFYGYLCTFLVITMVGSSVFYLYFKASTTAQFEAELSNGKTLMQNMIRGCASSSIRTYLKAVAEKNLDIMIALYHQDIPEKEAKRQAARILTSQRIGKTGAIYSVSSRGIIQAHPDRSMVGKNISENSDGVFHLGQKHGFLEYTTSTGEKSPQEMASYMTYFGPWDWIVTPFAPKKELISALPMDTIRKTLLARQFSGSGYAFIMDSKGNMIVHPHLEGENVLSLADENGRRFIAEMSKTQNGRIIFPWQDPGSTDSRMVLSHFGYIEELDWIVAACSYVDELRQPLTTLRTLIFLSIIVVGLIFFALTMQISRTITQPIKYLMSGFKAVSKGDFTTRLSPKSTDELGRLESYFNSFIAQLQESNDRLHDSEKDFRSIFENAVEGIFQFDMVGNILKVNPSFVAMFGYDSSEAILEDALNLQRSLIVKKEIWNYLLETIISERAVKGLELQMYKKSGSVFWVLLNARAIYQEGSDKIILIEGFLSDINERKTAQETQVKLMEDLEVMVDKRTVELSTRIAELEHRNQLSRYMGEMGDMLQSCRSLEETFPVIHQYLKLFFPQDNAALYIHDNTKQMIDRVIPAVSETTPFLSMTNESCWALRQGKIYLFNPSMDHELTCDHVDEAPFGYICIPLIAQGVTMGLLHITFSSQERNLGNGDATVQLDRKKRLCTRLADHLSLALANLRLQEKLKIKSIQDSLTGLANRRHMEEILQRQFYRMLRYNTPCSIIMIDVDHFKHFNDTYGHDMGDYVLKELASYLKDNTRGEDLACRYGGEEFIIVLVDTDFEQAAKKAEMIRSGIAETIAIPFLAEKLHITVSVGVATSPRHGRNMQELIKAADKALYRAKENGRNRVEAAM